jgi:hypothetical protein
VAGHVDAAASESHAFGAQTAALAFPRKAGQRDASAVPKDAMPRDPDEAASGESA